MKKIAVITCYHDPDYVRARTLRSGIASLPGHELIVIKNAQRGWLRYPEVALAVLRARFTQNPDVYLLTFRGYEMLLWVLLVGLGKRVIFDEFINATEWFAYEHKKFSPSSVFGKVFNAVYGWLLRHCDTILTDTDVHADVSARLSHVPREKYVSIPVGTDEAVFFPAKVVGKSRQFKIFFYGNILPLHGLEVMLDAALLLKDEAAIDFTFIGGKDEHRQRIEQTVAAGAHIEYISRVPFEQLPSFIHDASLCLSGPFGNTFQAQYVVTGKTYQFLAAAVPTVLGKNEATTMFTDKVDCLLVPQGDARALVAAIRWAKAHPKDLAAIGTAGRKLYEQQFSNQRITQLLSKLFGLPS